MPSHRDEDKQTSSPDCEAWISAMAVELKISFDAGDSDQLDLGDALVNEQNFREAEASVVKKQSSAEGQGTPQLTVPMKDRPDEQPRPDSRMQVEFKADGTMIIDPYSVPRTVATAHGAGLDGVRKAVYAPTKHATDVTGNITRPIKLQDLAQGSVARGGAAYLQDYPAMDNAVIKRPIALQDDPEGPVEFLGTETLIHETTILSALGEFENAKGNRHIVKVMGSGVTNDGEPFVIMEKLQGGTLESRIREHGLDPEQLEEFAAGLLAGISFLQNRNVIHQDLKIDNIMFRQPDSCEPVIIDFDAASAREGIAAQTDDYVDFRYQRAGSPLMQPPERQGGKVDVVNITPKLDSWTGALCLIAAAVGKNSQGEMIENAYELRSDQAALDQSLDACLKGVPHHVTAVIKGLMRIDLKERLTAEQALESLNRVNERK